MIVTLLGIRVFLHPNINVFVSVSIIALQLLRESYFVFPVSILIDVRYSDEKANSSMFVTLLGMMTEFRPLQAPKASPPMLITLLGIVIEVRPLPQKAMASMLVTLLGMVTEVRFLQNKKAPLPMLVSPVKYCSSSFAVVVGVPVGGSTDTNGLDCRVGKGDVGRS